jgi:hypothetical protein
MIKQVAKELHNTKPFAVFMISVMLVGIFSLSPVIASLFNNVTIRSSGTIATILPLHVEGRYIKNSLNQTIILRGVNQAGMLDDPDGWWNPEGGSIYSGVGVWNPDAVKYNLDVMKTWRINVLRLLLSVEWWKNDESNYRQHVKDTIAWAGERGIYVLVVFWNVQGKGSPDPLPFPPYSLNGSETIIADVDEFVSVWASVVQELSIYSNVLFEFWNEPRGNAEAKQAWFNAVQQIITAIRNITDSLVVVQWGYGIGANLSTGNTGGADMSWVEDYPLSDLANNIVYSFHNYRGDFRRTIPEWIDCWEYDDLNEGYELCLVPDVLYNLSKPVICGEIGANMWWTGEDLERELAYFNNSLSIYNEWNMSYIAWVWTVPAHMQYGLLQNGYWCPPPTRSGEILISKIAEGH